MCYNSTTTRCELVIVGVCHVKCLAVVHMLVIIGTCYVP